jgi:hypothetical protein
VSTPIPYSLGQRLRSLRIWAQRLRRPGTTVLPMETSEAVKALVLIVDESMQWLPIALNETASQVEPIPNQVSEIVQKLHGLHDEVKKLRTEHERLQKAQQTAASNLKKVHEFAKTLDSTVTVANARFAQLKRQFDALMSPDHLADFDDWARGMSPLSEQAASGRQASEQLKLMDPQVWHSKVARRKEVAGDLERCQRQAVTAAYGLTELKATDATKLWRTTITAWTENRGKVERLRPMVRSAEAEAQAAAIELDAHGKKAAQLEGIAEQGAQAEQRLRYEIAAYLGHIFAKRLIPPSWFDHAMGYGVPADTAEWRETATDVVLYRTVYGVRDDFLALGPAPSGGAQLAEYNHISARCTKYATSVEATHW